MQHVTALSLKISVPRNAKMPAGSGMGPYTQGILMEHIDSDYTAYLHSLPFNPYSQYCRFDEKSNQLDWRVSALTDEAAEHIIVPLQKLDSVFIKRLGAEASIESKAVEIVSVKSFTDAIASDGQRTSTIHFITPTAFKSDGSYVFMPTVRLIMQNLLMRYGQVYSNDKEIDPETIDYLSEHTLAVSYNLRSCYFDHVMSGKRKIPAFIGSLTVKTDGSQQLVGLVRMLLKFGNYAGIGIKTSMGMGGTLCE